MKVYIKNRQRLLRPDQRKIATLLRKALLLLGLPRAEISILFVGDKSMRALNLRYRGIDRTTDVLSFPQVDAPAMAPAKTTGDLVLGDIVISLPKAVRQAAENGLAFHEELKRLLVHGLLHLIGYDHEISRYQERKMQKKADELLASLQKL